MSCMPAMMPTSFGVAVAPRTGKFIKDVFGRGEYLLQNGILHFVCRFRQLQLSEIALESVRISVDEKSTFLKEA